MKNYKRSLIISYIIQIVKMNKTICITMQKILDSKNVCFFKLTFKLAFSGIDIIRKYKRQYFYLN